MSRKEPYRHAKTKENEPCSKCGERPRRVWLSWCQLCISDARKKREAK